MTVREWIESKKKTVTINEVVLGLESLIDHGRETYGKSLDEEYDGWHDGVSEDPWVGDVLFCEKAIELINDLVNHIENFEDDSADEVLKTLGVNK